jgi:hypothetical protein
MSTVIDGLPTLTSLLRVFVDGRSLRVQGLQRFIFLECHGIVYSFDMTEDRVYTASFAYLKNSGDGGANVGLSRLCPSLAALPLCTVQLPCTACRFPLCF